MVKAYSRRSFLHLAAAGAASALLAACQPKVVEVEKVVKETVVVEKVVEKEVQPAQPAEPSRKVVRLLMSSWAVGEIPFDRTAREYNDAHPDTEIRIETAAEGWDTKVIAQINAGTLEWCAAGICSPYRNMRIWVKTGMVQPMDTYIDSSSEPGADQVFDDMIDIAYQDSSFEGKFYGLGYSYENITLNWRTDYFGAVGVNEVPATYDDYLEACREVKTWGADQNIYPTAFAGGLHTDVWGLYAGRTDKPYRDDGLLDWESPEMEESLALFKKMVVEEHLTPPHGGDGWLDAYYAGKVASVQAQSSRGVWGQKAFGTDKVMTSPVAARSKDAIRHTAMWVNATCVLNKAPYPQEVTDYLVYTMGPQNVGFQKTVIQTGKTPIYESIYSSVIETDPQFRMYAWMIDMRDAVKEMAVVPRDINMNIQESAWVKWRTTFTEENSTMTPKECAQNILTDIVAEVAKQKL